MAKKERFSKIKNFYKTNRIYCILMIISVICLIMLGSGVILYFVHQASSNKYGNRLDGISEYKVDTELKSIESYFKESDKVKEVEVRLQGKIIYIDVEVDEKTTNEEIQNLSNESLTKLTDEQKEFYDIQYIYMRNNLTPMFGSKSSHNKIITWAKYEYEEETTTTVKTTKKK